MAKWFKAVWITVMIAHVLSIISWIVKTTHVFQQGFGIWEIIFLMFVGFFSFLLLAMSFAAIWLPRTRANKTINYVSGTLIMIGLVYSIRWYLEYH